MIEWLAGCSSWSSRLHKTTTGKRHRRPQCHVMGVSLVWSGRRQAACSARQALSRNAVKQISIHPNYSNNPSQMSLPIHESLAAGRHAWVLRCLCPADSLRQITDAGVIPPASLRNCCRTASCPQNRPFTKTTLLKALILRILIANSQSHPVVIWGERAP